MKPGRPRRERGYLLPAQGAQPPRRRQQVSRYHRSQLLNQLSCRQYQWYTPLRPTRRRDHQQRLLERRLQNPPKGQRVVLRSRQVRIRSRRRCSS
ncbi:hypothetical protein PF003_g11390 [Phytophthora fragariae]|nr:hypothetical protein PF003_g11390 [Phytophthora fragariae]